MKNALLLNVDHFLLTDYTALQDSVVGIVSRLQSGRPWNCVSAAGRGKTFVSSKHPNHLSFYPAPYAVGAGDLSPQVKMAGA